MKKYFAILSFLTCMALMFSACEKEKPEPEPTPEPENGIVRFELTGDCTPVKAEEGYIAASTEERSVSNIQAVLFKDGLFYKYIELKDVNAKYSFEEEEGTYKMQLLANLNPETLSLISGLKPGESKFEDYQSINLTSKALEGGYLPMLSETTDLVISSEKENDLGKISLKMPLVRIDILNGAEGAEIKSVTLKNAFDNIPLSLETSKAQDREISIENFSGTGTHENPAINKSILFIYPDASTEMTVVYDIDGTEESKTFNMKNSSINAGMIWGVIFNKNTKLDITEITATMEEGYKPEFTVPATEFTIGIALKGDAQYAPSSAYEITPLKYETEVTNAYLAIFKDNKLYSFLSTEKYAGKQFQTIIHENGIFEILVIANASEELATSMANVEQGSSKDVFLEVMTSQEAMIENMFLMVSDFKIIEVNKQWNYFPDINMHRLAARIDIINAVSGMTIEKVTFRNRAIQTPLCPDSIEGNAFEDKEYTDFEGIGDIKNYSIFTGKIYSYQNTSEDNIAELTVEYAINGEHGEKTINFSTVGGIHYGKLYSVVLSGSKVDFAIREEDWTNGYAPVIGNEQDKMNSALAVNHFTEYNVKDIDNSGKIVFCESNTATGDLKSDSKFFPWKDSFSTDIFQDQNGNEYRIPTSDEILLLFPKESGVIVFNKSSILKNISETLPSSMFDGHNGGTGESVFRNMEFKSTLGGYVVYGLRFKGTDQYSAYRYEIFTGDNEDGFLSVKIKALDKDDNIDVVSISDAVSPQYWSEGYIEYVFPLDGVKLGSDNPMEGVGTYSNIWYHDSENAYVIHSSYSGIKSFPEEEGQEANIRLVSTD